MTWGCLALALAFHACPFCGVAPTRDSMTQAVAGADFVAYGQLSDPRLPASDVGDAGATTFDILQTIKPHSAIGARQRVRLDRWLDPRGGKHAIVFVDVVDDGRLDPYRLAPASSPKVADYVAGAVALADRPATERIGYFFDRLGDPVEEVARDAFTEFARLPYREVVSAPEALDAKKLRAWLADRQTPAYQVGLLGCLLGTVGEPADASRLCEWIERRRQDRQYQGVDGLMGGYCLLDPKKGIADALATLNATDDDFALRWAALQALKFALAEIAEIEPEPILRGMAPAIESDLGDLVIDEYVRRRFWAPVADLLACSEKPAFANPRMQSALLRLALACSSEPAKAFVAKREASDPKLVADAREQLAAQERAVEFQRRPRPSLRTPAPGLQ